MYTKIMVPLDGSELAECVLPHVEAFIKGFNLRDVILVRVVEPEDIPAYRVEGNILSQVTMERESSRKSAAEDYLAKIGKRLKQEGTALHAEVLIGRVTESLIDYAEQKDIDLIVIATHGRSGVTRWVRGSVADRILHSANVPVLMVRAPGTKGGI
jgi:nucleotide-binding universal stress UspA family protein